MRISEDDALRAATTTKQIRTGAGLEQKMTEIRETPESERMPEGSIYRGREST